MSLEVLGQNVELAGEYGRAANPAMHALLDERKLRPHPVHVLGRGFCSILDGIRELKSSSASAGKLVVLVG